MSMRGRSIMAAGHVLWVLSDITYVVRLHLPVR